jgi:hypothetical protein
MLCTQTSVQINFLSNKTTAHMGHLVLLPAHSNHLGAISIPSCTRRLFPWLCLLELFAESFFALEGHPAYFPACRPTGYKNSALEEDISQGSHACLMG